MEMVFTFGIMVFLGSMAVFSLGFRKESIAGDSLGAAGFPLLIIGIGLVLCTMQLYREVKAGKAARKGPIDFTTSAGRVVVYSALALAGYIALFNFLGFILSTFVFSLVAAYLMGYRKKMMLVAFSVMTTTALFLLFGKAFFVPLPRGVGFLRDLSYFLY